MINETVSLIVSRMNNMSDAEREQVMCALLNRFCVGCGRAGDFSDSPCDCEPGKPAAASCDDAPRQLWLTYKAA